MCLMNLLLVSRTQLKRVLDPLLVLPVRDVDESDEELVPVSELAGRAGHRAGAGPPGGEAADNQQPVTQNHVALLQLFLVSAHLQREDDLTLRNLNVRIIEQIEHRHDHITQWALSEIWGILTSLTSGIAVKPVR